MATRILKVEVENDFLNKVSNSGAYTAISELVWNSLDADASTVKVRLCEDAIMGGWDKLQVIDDGIGISNKVADKHFSKLGGSWKKFAQKTKKGRFLHGQEGQGRFKPFSLGRIIDWNTVYLEESQQQLQSLVITGKSEEIGNFTLNDGSPKDELRHTGTTVTISELTPKGLKVSENGLINYISCAFAIYLAKYPTISLYVNDKKIDPAEYVEHEDTIDLPSVIFEEESYAYSLKVIEWKCDTKNELHFCDSNGFPLHSYDKTIRGTSDFNYTAYLISDHISKLSSKGVLELGSLEPTLSKPIDDALASLKNHLYLRRIAKSANIIQKWKDEDIYPYSGKTLNTIDEAERQIFDVLAINISQELPDFEKAPVKVKKLQFRLLKQIVTSNPNDLQLIFEEVLNLTVKKQKELAELLQDVSLTSIINASKIISDRLKFIAGLEHIVFDPEKKKVLKERSQLHKILAENTWIFGDAFALSVNDQSLTEVLKKHLKAQNVDLIPNKPVTRIDSSRGIVDLMLTQSVPQNHAEQLEHLVIELKAPKVAIGAKEIQQIESYAFAVAADERFNKLDVRWNFWIVSNDTDAFADNRAKQDKTGQGIIYQTDNVTIQIKTWGQLIKECKHRLEFVRSHLDLDVKTTDGLQYLQENYSEYTESIILDKELLTD
ncbi:ATP-binding protein [Vibrio renipiscarius]|uniref:DNA mismatch repair protein n=3 Tax=Vibrio TaxID=662 RepID=A0A0C2NWN4_9VIBR|nr:ATP-binding protein [Vibrio renipiscarius]KII80530.1 DNA mismatch repair protein [Vibrio renipiscarius]